MKFTYDWLKEYLDTDLKASEISDNLTRIGLEVEGLEKISYPIAAKIIECYKHADSDNLSVLKVDDGSGTLRQVICGAPNARVGMISALAVPGVKIAGTLISSGKIRGVLSDGMMCSGKELGINDDSSGILDLDPKDEKIGSVISQFKNAPTIVFDSGITPNRPDYLAVYGIAHDLSAAGIGKFKERKSKAFPKNKGARKVTIENKTACPTYRLYEIHGIDNKPSDVKIASRLSAIGINPKNTCVDTTNYISYDMAQPMHCFDADKLSGDIVVRNAKIGEKFTDLLDTEHILNNTDIVITDDKGILALAGVIGGKRASTSKDTKNIVLESAYFEPIGIRKTSKRLGLSSDSSYRYERGIDPNITGKALDLALDIIQSRCGGELVGAYTDGRTSFIPKSIKYNPNLFLKKTGIELSQNKQQEILKSLGFGLDIVSKEVWSVTPKSARVDIEIPENIVSELIRIYGYDNIKVSKRPAIPGVSHNSLDYNLKSFLANRGLTESISFGFGNRESENLLNDKKSILISNPITQEFDTMRNTLLGGILDAISLNEKRGFSDLSMFEQGTVFDGDMPGQQHKELVIARVGNTSPKHWLKRNRPFDIFDIKADLLSILGDVDFTIESDNPPFWAHPFKYGRIIQDKKIIAHFAELHPIIARTWKIKNIVNLGLVQDTSILPNTPVKLPVISTEFQQIHRDFAFVIDRDFSVEKIISVAKKADKRITNITVFDSFEMGDKKSIAFSITITPNENMSDESLLKIQTNIISMIEKSCSAKLRDK